MKELLTIASFALLVASVPLPALAGTSNRPAGRASTGKVHELRMFHDDLKKARVAALSEKTRQNDDGNNQTVTPSPGKSLDYGSDTFIIIGG